MVASANPQMRAIRIGGAPASQAVQVSTHSGQSNSSSQHQHPHPHQQHHHRTLHTDLTALTSDTSTISQVPPKARPHYPGMSDGKNEARALRILELMNDFRTLQAHIRSHISAANSTPPDAASQSLQGYVILRQCSVAAQTILATSYNPGSLGIVPGQMPATEVQKASLQRIILDAATRRFQAHKLYLQVSAARRWILARGQLLQGATPGPQHQAALRAIDQRLREELVAVTDAYVYTDLRNADRRKNYWLDEDPSLERILAWARSRT